MKFHFFSSYIVLVACFLLPFSAVQAQEQAAIRVVREKLGKVKHPALQELSGIVPSRANPNCFWVHNDSGDEAKIYLIDATAKLLCTYKLAGVNATDFEEIGWMMRNGIYHLIVGDIGDNRGKRKQVQFHVFPEPVWRPEHKNAEVANISSFASTYPDGPRDAEAFFVDPLTNQLVVFSKRDFHVHVYTADFLQAHAATHAADGRPYVLKKELSLPLFFITAADISADGKQILLKNLTNIYYWKRQEQESVMTALRKAYLEIPYSPEPQGEAIAFDRDGMGFYTISERPLGLDSYLYQYQFVLE